MKAKLLKLIRKHFVVAFAPTAKEWVVSYLGKDAETYGATAPTFRGALHGIMSYRLPIVAFRLDWNKPKRLASAKRFDKLLATAMLPHLVNDYNKPF